MCHIFFIHSSVDGHPNKNEGKGMDLRSNEYDLKGLPYIIQKS